MRFRFMGRETESLDVTSTTLSGLITSLNDLPTIGNLSSVNDVKSGKYYFCQKICSSTLMFKLHCR